MGKDNHLMATKANLMMDQGATFSVTINITDDNGLPLDLSGFTASSQMKKWYTSSNSVTFNTTINTQAGFIVLELDANLTSFIVPGRYVYDVDITDGISITRVVEGLVYVSPGVTNITPPTLNYALAPDGSQLVTSDGDYIVF
jgi:hypothetical protein